MTSLMFDGVPLEKIEHTSMDERTYHPSKGKFTTKGEEVVAAAKKTLDNFLDSTLNGGPFFSPPMTYGAVKEALANPMPAFVPIEIKDFEVPPASFRGPGLKFYDANDKEGLQEAFGSLQKGLKKMSADLFKMPKDAEVRLLPDTVDIQFDGKCWNVVDKNSMYPASKLDECPICEMEQRTKQIGAALGSAFVSNKKKMELARLTEADLNEAHREYIDSFEDPLATVDTKDLTISQKLTLDADVKYFKTKREESYPIKSFYYFSNKMRTESHINVNDHNADRRLGGFPKGITTVVGRSGQGISTFMSMSAAGAAKFNKVLFLSSEGFPQSQINDFEKLSKWRETQMNQTGALMIDYTHGSGDRFLNQLEDILDLNEGREWDYDAVFIDGLSQVMPFDFQERRKFVNRLNNITHKFNVATIVGIQSSRNRHDSGDDLWQTADIALLTMSQKALQIQKVDGISISEAKIVKDRYGPNTAKKAYFHLQARRFLDV